MAGAKSHRQMTVSQKTSSDKVSCSRLSPEAVILFHDTIRASIEPAVEFMQLDTFDNVWDLILKNYLVVWMVLDDDGIPAFVITKIEKHPSGDSAMRIIFAGKNPESDSHVDICIEKAYRSIRENAIEQGCKYIHIEGRPGWVRTFYKHGIEAKPRAIVYVEELEQ